MPLTLLLFALSLIPAAFAELPPPAAPMIEWDAAEGELHWQRNNNDPAIDYWLEFSRRSDFATLTDSRWINNAGS
ncbi:MAG TPA: hypothetical protein VIN71_03080, partial [Pseudomonadales bacterium]